MWAQRDLAISAIHKGDEESAATAIEQLMNEYASREGMPEALYFLGNYYLETDEDDRAKFLYDHLLAKYPDHELAPVTKARLGQTKLREGNDNAAETIYQEVLADCVNHPRLPEAAVLMAEGYYLRGSAAYQRGQHDWADHYLREAVAKADMVIMEPPEDPLVRLSGLNIAGLSYRRLGEYKNAAGYLKVIMAEYPDYPYLGNVCYVLACCYYEDGNHGEAINYFTKFLHRWPHHDGVFGARVRMVESYKQLHRQGAISLKEAIAASKPIYDALPREEDNQREQLR